jgi:lipopolysaccharide export system permease protein
MSSVHRYILKQAAITLVGVTLALTLAVWLAHSLRFLDYIVMRGLPVSTFFYLVALLLPKFLAIVLPIAVFSAVTFTYHRLTADSETVVLRASGVSDIELARAALVLATLTTLLVYGLNSYVRPASERVFKDLQLSVRTDYSALLIQPGVFTNYRDGLTIFVREQASDGELRGLMIHDTRDARKKVTVMAERGALASTPGGPRVVLMNGNRQEVESDTNKLSLLYFERYTVDLGGIVDVIGERWRESRERSIHELLTAKVEDVGPRAIAQFRAEGHDRLASPLYTLAFPIIALALLLHGDFNRRGQARRIALAIAVVLVVQAASIGFKQVATKLPDLLPLIYINALLPIAIGLYVLTWPARRRPRAALWPTGAS